MYDASQTVPNNALLMTSMSLLVTTYEAKGIARSGTALYW
jgi:hypothetical protein